MGYKIKSNIFKWQLNIHDLSSVYFLIGCEHYTASMIGWNWTSLSYPDLWLILIYILFYFHSSVLLLVLLHLVKCAILIQWFKHSTDVWSILDRSQAVNHCFCFHNGIIKSVYPLIKICVVFHWMNEWMNELKFHVLS